MAFDGSQKSTPNLLEFEPLKSQLEIIKHVRRGADYSQGTQEIMLSGSVGSSKSLTLAHLVVTHCLMYPKARAGIGRLALPQLKETLCVKIKEHLEGTGVDYKYYSSTGDFDLPNGSEIRTVSWSDQNFSKLGSLEFSCFAIEELTESRDSRAYDTILQRVNRLPHVKEPWLISATNPDSPSHWAYKKLISTKAENVRVFYSNTFDNPYLDPNYIKLLKSRMDHKMAQRMIYGQWVELHTEVVYYAFSPKNIIQDTYKIDPRWPIRICYDFNIGEGKPLSAVMAQYDQERDEWHFFSEIIVEGQRTLDSLEEMESRGLFENENLFIIHGDATGRARDTRSPKSDYDLIEKFMSNVTNKKGNKIPFRVDVPRGNPRIRERHNVVNSYLLNSLDQAKLFVYKDCPILEEGFRLTKLKKGGNYLEDDSDYFQHVTTAAGYGIHYVRENMSYYFGSPSGDVGGF
jgi:hypothetical protein